MVGDLLDALGTVSGTGSILSQVAVSAGLLAVTIVDVHVVWPFFALAALTGAASASGWPAYQALTPEVVRPDLVPGAVALRSVAGQIAVIAGPAVGGLLFAWKAEAVYGLAALLFAVAGISMAALRLRSVPGEAPVGLARP